VVTVAQAPAGVPAPHLGIFAEMSGIAVVDIAHAIQLAVAPVLLLSGVGIVLGVLRIAIAVLRIGSW
jgi:hypothetical protein